MYDTIVMDTKPLTIDISLVDADIPKPLPAPVNGPMVLNFKVVRKDLSSIFIN